MTEQSITITVNVPAGHALMGESRIPEKKSSSSALSQGLAASGR